MSVFKDFQGLEGVLGGVLGSLLEGILGGSWRVEVGKREAGGRGILKAFSAVFSGFQLVFSRFQLF